MDVKTLEAGTAEVPLQQPFFVRRGLLYTLLATTAFYFSSGSSAYTMPVEIPENVAGVWIPLLFLSGLGYTLLASFRPVSHLKEYSAVKEVPIPSSPGHDQIVFEIDETSPG